MKKRSMLLLIMLGVSATLLPTPQANACSCVTMPQEYKEMKALVQEADGAVVGTVTNSEDASDGTRDITVQVASATNGIGDASLVLQSPASTCGLFVQPGQEMGFLLRGEPGAWSSDLCSTVEPTLLRDTLVRMGQGERPPPPQFPGTPLADDTDWTTKLWIAIPGLLILGLTGWVFLRFSRRSRA